LAVMVFLGLLCVFVVGFIVFPAKDYKPNYVFCKDCKHKPFKMYSIDGPCMHPKFCSTKITHFEEVPYRDDYNLMSDVNKWNDCKLFELSDERKYLNNPDRTM